MTELRHQQKEHIKEIFNRTAFTYDQLGPRFFSYFGKNMIALAKIRPGSRVLDVATGRGALLFPIAEMIGSSGSIVGIDLSPEMVKQTQLEARHRSLRNVKVECMDAEELGFPDNSFDYVLCGFSLFFFPSLDKALFEFSRVLKPGGQFIVSIWGRGDIRWKWLGEVVEQFKPFFISDPNITQSHFHGASALKIKLRDARFLSIHTVTDMAEFIYADAEEWWTVQWSHANRALLESIHPDKLFDFKRAIFNHLRLLQENDGIHQRFKVIYAFAKKAGETTRFRSLKKAVIMVDDSVKE